MNKILGPLIYKSLNISDYISDFGKSSRPQFPKSKKYYPFFEDNQMFHLEGENVVDSSNSLLDDIIDEFMEEAASKWKNS